MIEGAGELTKVAALSIAAGVDVGRQGTFMVCGVVGGAAGDIEHRRTLGSDGTIGACGDTFTAF